PTATLSSAHRLSGASSSVAEPVHSGRDAMVNAETRSTTNAVATARTRIWTVASALALGWAFLTLLILHLVSSFDPLFDPISRYAFTDHGEGMLEVSLLSFGIGVIGVLGALIGSGLVIGRTTPLLAGFST